MNIRVWRKETFASWRIGRGVFLEENDTASYLFKNLNGEVVMVRLSQFYLRCKDVKRELDSVLDIKRKFGGSKKIIVPKTMAIGNRNDDFQRLVLFTSLDHEEYDSEMIAKLLGYTDSIGITHRGLDVQQSTGRKVGECSVILDSGILNNLTIVFSDLLVASLKKSNALVAYSAGDQIFFCAIGPQFLEKYDLNMIRGLTKKESGI